jgi:hypothetical protein
MLTIGTTPLIRAAKAGDTDAIKLLLARGAKPDLANSLGITPVMAAAGLGSNEIDTRGKYVTQKTANDSIDLSQRAPKSTLWTIWGARHCTAPPIGAGTMW